MNDSTRQYIHESLSKVVDLIAPHKGRCRFCKKPMQGVFHAHTEFRAHKLDSKEHRHVVDQKFTTVGRDAIVDAFDTGVGFTLSDFEFHGSGDGAGAEADSETALVNEVEAPRDTGVASQPTADVYRTVGTHTYSGGFTIIEHGIFDQATGGGGALLDRTLFGDIVVVATDKIEFTFELTISSEA